MIYFLCQSLQYATEALIHRSGSLLQLFRLSDWSVQPEAAWYRTFPLQTQMYIIQASLVELRSVSIHQTLSPLMEVFPHG